MKTGVDLMSRLIADPNQPPALREQIASALSEMKTEGGRMAIADAVQSRDSRDPRAR